MGEQIYLDLLKDVISGDFKEDRTGTGTYSQFGRQIRFNLQEGFPLLTTKKMFTNSIFWELKWFLNGDTNVKFLHDHNVHIWDEWADENGELGPVYGFQWRLWEGSDGKIYDQIDWLVNEIKTNPNSRRLIVTAWNVSDINMMALPPCHCLFQFYVNNGKLSCQLYQRSADLFLGVPFNIASYSLLTHLVAKECGLEVGEFVHTFGDIHIYSNHIAQVNEQLSRVPLGFPRLNLDNAGALFDFNPDNVVLEGYKYHPVIKAPISV
jgi:thymidylate synthase